MENINDLFLKIYNKECENDDQLNAFLDYLEIRLSFEEKIFLFKKYGIDLLETDDMDKKIRIKMLHPIVKKAIFNEI